MTLNELLASMPLSDIISKYGDSELFTIAELTNGTKDPNKLPSWRDRNWDADLLASTREIPINTDEIIIR